MDAAATPKIERHIGSLLSSRGRDRLLGVCAGACRRQGRSSGGALHLDGSGASARSDGYEIRSAAVTADIPCVTTVPGAAAAVMGIEALIAGDMAVRPLQELHAALLAPAPPENK